MKSFTKCPIIIADGYCQYQVCSFLRKLNIKIKSGPVSFIEIVWKRISMLDGEGSHLEVHCVSYFLNCLFSSFFIKGMLVAVRAGFI